MESELIQKLELFSFSYITLEFVNEGQQPTDLTIEKIYYY